MTKQRAFERKLIADALKVCLARSVSPEPDLHMGDITVGWKEALEGESGKDLYNKMSLVDICKRLVSNRYMFQAKLLAHGAPSAETVRRKGCLQMDGRPGVPDLISGSATSSFIPGCWAL